MDAIANITMDATLDDLLPLFDWVKDPKDRLMRAIRLAAIFRLQREWLASQP